MNKSVDMTLGKALRRKIQEEGKSVKDIDFVSVRGLSFSLERFWDIVNNLNVSIENLNDDFKIVFKDGTWISKHYNGDGSVRLKYHPQISRPTCKVLNVSPQDFLGEG